MGRDMVAQTPVMKQFLDVKSQYKDALVLFRMGDFYETFLDDAIITSKILGIVLTKRSNGKASNVDLAGFPYHALDNYLPKLVNAGYRVAICEQVEDPKLSKGIVRREVIEVVTPGTLTTDHVNNNRSNRYIGSIKSNKEYSGFALLDSSTGEFHIGECETRNLKNTLMKFSPNEIILTEAVVYSTLDWYLDLKPFITPVDDWIFEYDRAYRELINHFNLRSLKGFGCEDMTLGISASGALIYHIKNNLSSTLDHVSKISPIIKNGFMGLDGFTIKNLEVFQSLSSQGVHGTLVDCLDNTKTPGGARLLRRWLYNPLTDLRKLNKRLNMVDSFLKNSKIITSIQESLSRTSDIQRILGKVNQAKASPREVIALATTLSNIPKWIEILIATNEKSLSTLSKSFINVNNLVKRIKETLNEAPPAQINMGNVIRSGIDNDLDELRLLLSSGKEWISNFQDSLREQLDIPKLKVGFNRVFGYFIEITKLHQDKVPDSFIRKQTLVNSERYITEELKEYEVKVLNAEEMIQNIETQIFNEICVLILTHISKLQSNAKIINKMDLLIGFASNALDHKYVKPMLSNESVLEIIKGRHPVVEQLLPSTEKFIPNNLSIHSERNQIHLITGPNMAGKSTYLRQIGLITLMAQIGSFVPAEKAKVGIVDRLFTRVGASDNLAGGESTFLVEMNEAANILNNATDKSLILLDEIGRGTATFDGLSLAWAITEHLHNTDGLAARTLFATHYHELTVLEKTLERLENHHVEIKEFGNKIIFLRSISRGTGDKSYGIHVAKMAGLPGTVIERATQVLNHHIKESSKEEILAVPDLSNQMTFFQNQELELREKLNELNVDDMTPVEAIRFLDELKKEYSL